MGIHDAEYAMSSLESIKCTFDYGKADFYKAKVQKFIEQKNGLFPNQWALFDITQGRMKLPSSLDSRIKKWMENHPHYSPYMDIFARNYLVSLLEDSNATLYSHLAECVIEGGDFYLENGMLYLRDAAAVPTT